MSSDYYGAQAGELADQGAAGWDDDEPCDHDHDEECELNGCLHEHCWMCGGCGCPGYCDDYQTYNLRPAETGGEHDALEPARAITKEDTHNDQR